MPNHTTSRRAFLAFVAGSPLLAAAGVPADLRRRLAAGTVSRRDLIGVGEAMASHEVQTAQLIGAARDALDVLDFEAVAKAKLPPAHWGYLATGTDDDATIQANRDGFRHWAL